MTFSLQFSVPAPHSGRVLQIYINLNEKFIIFNRKFITFNTKFMTFNIFIFSLRGDSEGAKRPVIDHICNNTPFKIQYIHHFNTNFMIYDAEIILLNQIFIVFNQEPLL